MDAEFNIVSHEFTDRLVGYPHIDQSNTYNNRLSIDGEVEQINYKRLPTDDLSSIWATNNCDNIDDADLILRTADVNALEGKQYGASDLDRTSNDNFDFSRYLEPTKPVIESCIKIPKNIQKTCRTYVNQDMHDDIDALAAADNEPLPGCNTNKFGCFSNSPLLWLLLLVLIICSGVYSCQDKKPTATVPAPVGGPF
jgi:hypothetical protein